MAGIDPSIALGVKQFEAPNPLNAMAQYTQIQNAQQANQLNQMKMAEYERARAEEEGVRNALARGDIKLDTPEGRAGLLKYGKTGLEYGKALTEQQKAVVARQVEEAKLVADRTKQYRTALDFVHTPEQYLAWHEANHADPILGPALANMGVTAETSRANIMKQMATPGGFEKLINQSKLGAEKFIERTTQTAQEKATVAATLRGQNLTDARERERITNAQDPNAVAHQVVNDNGTVTNFNKFGQVISTVSGAGKQSATYAKAEAQKKTMGKDLDLAIGELANVTKDGGLIDQSTGSYIGKGVDIGARVFGKATPGDIAAGKLAPIADLALKMVPRFEGPQSNADTVSYKQAAGQLADSTLPAEIRKAAGVEVLRLMKARKNQFVTQDMASGNVNAPAGVDTSNPLLAP